MVLHEDVFAGPEPIPLTAGTGGYRRFLTQGGGAKDLTVIMDRKV